jgi:hypothetical protein
MPSKSGQRTQLGWIGLLEDVFTPVLTAVQGKYTVSLIEGDGIGPEISQAVKDIFAAAKVCSNNPEPRSLQTRSLTLDRPPSRGSLAM